MKRLDLIAEEPPVLLALICAGADARSEDVLIQFFQLPIRGVSPEFSSGEVTRSDMRSCMSSTSLSSQIPIQIPLRSITQVVNLLQILNQPACQLSQQSKPSRVQEEERAEPAEPAERRSVAGLGCRSGGRGSHLIRMNRGDVLLLRTCVCIQSLFVCRVFASV